METHVDTEVGRLFVADVGAGPPVVLWPSLYCDGRSFADVVAALQSERRCLVIDGPGHGKSSAAPRAYDLAACARAAFAIVDARVGPGAAVDWVGNAWGGHVGARAAIDHPARVRSLALISAPMEPLTSTMKLQKRLLELMLRAGLVAKVADLLGGVMVAKSAPPQAMAHLRACVATSPRAGLLQAIDCVSIRRPDLRPELARIACPTVFATGALNAFAKPEETARQAAMVKGARTEIIAGCAHLAPLEAPAATIALLRAHLGPARAAA